MLARLGFALFYISIVFTGVVYASDGAAPAKPAMSIRIVDEDLDGAVLQGPSDEDRVRVRGAGWLWLKRNGSITGDISEVHVATVQSEPVIQFTFTPETGAKFISLTRATLGHRLAIVLNNTIISVPLIAGEPDGLGIQMDGNYTEAEARELAAEMMMTIRPPIQTPFQK